MMRRRDTRVKRRKMCRSGIARGLPVEVNRALNVNRFDLCGFNFFFFCPPSDNRRWSRNYGRFAERMITGWRGERCESAKES